jgi:putative ABC transport system substrate-binding protein
MRRREFITLMGFAAGQPFVARAQSAHPIPQIGWLKIQGEQHTPDQLAAFRDGMKALGLVEGRDFVLEERYADGDEGRLPGLAAELIDSGVVIIVATNQPSIAAAWRVTKKVPVIGRMVDDPVVNGHGAVAGAAGRQCHRRLHNDRGNESETIGAVEGSSPKDPARRCLDAFGFSEPKHREA